MSNINTNSLNINFPVPGVNNNSQGFRDNFSVSKNNLDIAGQEITELQNKTLVKEALTNVNLDNDMNNTLISNALTLGFRGTTFDLGDNLTGTISIDFANGDVQYGTMVDDITLDFIKWAPNNTQSNIELIFNISDITAGWRIYFPTNVDDGTSTLENYVGSGVGGYIDIPTGIARLHFCFSTINAGSNITIIPLNRPRNNFGPSGVAGSNYQVQINYNNLFTGTDNFKFNPDTGTLTIGGNLLPLSSNTYNLGSITYSFNNLYLSGTTIYLGSSTIKADDFGSLDLSGNYGVKFPTGTPTYIGSTGDIPKNIKIDTSNIWISVGNYNGITEIWRKIPLTT